MDSLFDVDTYEFLLPLLLFILILTFCVIFPIYEMGFLLKDIKEIRDDKKIFMKNIKEQQEQIDVERIKQIEMIENEDSERKPVSLLKSYFPKEET